MNDERPETYAEQMHRKRFGSDQADALNRAEPLAAFMSKLVVIVLLFDGLAFWVVLFLCAFGVFPWGALLIPVGVACGVVILGFTVAGIGGLIDGLLGRRK